MSGSLVIRRLGVCWLLAPVSVNIAFIFGALILLFIFSGVVVFIIRIATDAGIGLLAVRLFVGSILFMK
jgi:hypothetical protein